jgi:beta-aspartyl-peptidase (threonine type)
MTLPSIKQPYALILHGGAGTLKRPHFNAKRAGLATAIAVGRNVLEGNGTALDAVEAAVRSMEDDPAFNAGYGSVWNSRGEIEMDAAIMDGTTLDIGAVGALQGVRYPVAVARALLREKPVLLVAEGAEAFAREIGAERARTEAVTTEGQEELDTVGCIALDRNGDIAVATSTGGLSGKHPGRVGDAPLAGAGFYAETKIGGVAFSGEGEAVIRTALAARAMAEILQLTPQIAMERAMERIALIGAKGGGIALDATGAFGWAHNTSHFGIAFAREGEEPEIHLARTNINGA